MYVCVCVAAYLPCVCKYQKPEGGIRFLGAGAIDGYEPREVGAGNPSWAPTSVPGYFSSPYFLCPAEETEAPSACISCAGEDAHTTSSFQPWPDTDLLVCPPICCPSIQHTHPLTCCCSDLPAQPYVSTVLVTKPGNLVSGLTFWLSPLTRLCPGKVLFCFIFPLLWPGNGHQTALFSRTMLLFPGIHCLQTLVTYIWLGFMIVYSKGEIPLAINLSCTEVNCSSLYMVTLPPWQPLW